MLASYIEKSNLRSLNTLAPIDAPIDPGGDVDTFSRLMSVGQHDESGGV